MPYKDPSKARQAKREWAAKKRAEKRAQAVQTGEIEPVEPSGTGTADDLSTPPEEQVKNGSGPSSIDVLRAARAAKFRAIRARYSGR